MLGCKRTDFVLIVLLLTFFVFVIYIWAPILWPTSPSSVEVSSCNLTKSTIFNYESTSIVFTLKNRDNQSSHEVTVHLSTTAGGVYFTSGSEMNEVDLSTFDITLNPSENTTEQINARVYFLSIADKLNCTITVAFLVDGFKIKTNSFILTIQV